MVVLPKRCDPMYIEIEKFAPYELTQCIAYEMAVRNDHNLKAIDDVINYYNMNHNNYEFYNYYANGTGDDDVLLDILYNLINKVNIINLDIINLKYQDKNFIKKEFYEIVEVLIGLIKGPHWDDHVSDAIGESIINNVSRVGYTIFTQIIDNNPLPEPTTMEYLVCKEIQITENFSRPKLYVDKFRTKSAILSIDLNKPVDELVALIKHIKNDLEENKDILKSPIELLGGELKLAGNQPENESERWATLFFLYDYIKAKKNDIKNYNDEVRKKYDEKILEVKKNQSIDSYDKKIQILELEKDHNSDKVKMSIKSTFNDKELTKQLNLSGGNISKLYYAIKPYIDKSKYKELVTGVSMI